MSRHSMFFAPGEWYHCYSRGIDKRITFKSRYDYERFVELLYLANNSESAQRSDLTHYDHAELFAIPRGQPLVSIGAYALMPNNFHLLLYEINERGISTFMQKLGTAYTMYFNIKNDRSGSLFAKPFRAQHVKGNRYFQHVVDYIHLNSAEIFERGWKQGQVAPINEIENKVITYPYSSLQDFEGSKRPESKILGKEINVYDKKSPTQMIKNARAYYTEFVEATP